MYIYKWKKYIITDVFLKRESDMHVTHIPADLIVNVFVTRLSPWPTLYCFHEALCKVGKGQPASGKFVCGLQRFMNTKDSIACKPPQFLFIRNIIPAYS